MPDTLDLIKPASNGDYIGKIRKRLNEDASARAEREKRRRKVLVDQLKSHEAQEVGIIKEKRRGGGGTFKLDTVVPLFSSNTFRFESMAFFP